MASESEIIALDRLNMECHIQASGCAFDPVRRSNGLSQELKEGAEVLEVRRNSTLVAYLEYLPIRDGVIRVPSIQVHPMFHGTSVLRSLLSSAASKMSGWPEATLQSKVHLTNVASIRLHQKLGFSQVSSNNSGIVFETSLVKLRSRLSHFKRMPNPSINTDAAR